MVLIVYIITIILTGVALFVGLSSNMFGLFDNQTKIQFASFASSVLILLIGDRLATLLSNRNLIQDHAQIIDNKIQDHALNIDNKFSEIPQINVIKEFATSDDALLYLANRIQDSKVIMNTKISKEVIQYRQDVGSLFNSAIKKALKNGLIYRDLISPGFEDSSEKLKQYSDNCNGTYEYQIQDEITSSFLNFIILDYGDEEELVFGWATSVYMGMEQKAYKVRDKRVISYFKDYHRSLFSNKGLKSL